jgi:hypothetical protein
MQAPLATVRCIPLITHLVGIFYYGTLEGGSPETKIRSWMKIIHWDAALSNCNNKEGW